MTQKRRNEITGLRGLSACAIAYIFHYTELFGTMPERFPIQAAVMGFLARYSVCMSEIFFMLSGLLLYWSYQTRLSEGKLTLGSFILPKMKKIYPMMIASALVTWFLQKVGYAIYGVYILHSDGAETRNSIKALIVSLLGLQTGWISDNDTLAVNGPSWFVSVFFVCYAIYYLLTRYVRGRLWQNLSYIAMMALGIFLMVHPLGLPLLYCTSGRGYFSFFAGIILAQIIERMRGQGKTLSCILAAVVLIGSLVLAESHENLRTLWYVSAFVWTSLIYLVCQVDILRKIFGAKPFVWLGNACMPIFLWNMATDLGMELVNRLCHLDLNYSSLTVWCLHVAVSLLVVWIMDRGDCLFHKKWHG